MTDERERGSGSEVDEDCELQFLEGVSRTFALTIPQLPPGLRGAVANAYLLCRIADTIEDESALDADRKQRFFRGLVDAVGEVASPERLSSDLYRHLSDATPQAERDLIRGLPLVLQTTRALRPAQKSAVVHCLEIMCEGMAAFQTAKSVEGLQDLRALDRYCYHVAGVVGEMLTELFCEYSPQVMAERERLIRLAVSFGQGLQMTNILKDFWEDRENGACWLPRDVFLRTGLDLGTFGKDGDREAFGDGLSTLVGIAYAHLKNGLGYSLLIPKREQGIRRFCLWAIGMAVFTLKKIKLRPDFSQGDQVKISRRTVKSTIAAIGLASRSDLLLRGLFGLWARGLSDKRASEEDPGLRRPYSRWSEGTGLAKVAE